MNNSSFEIPSEYRKRIYKQFDECSRYPLIGVLGETGFNKTGLISNWLDDRGYRHLWLDGPSMVKADFCLSDLIRTASGSNETLYIVINRYHHIVPDSTIHEELTELIESNPSNLRVIINDRIPPSLALTRMKAHHLYAQVENIDLAYTPEETEYFFTVCFELPLRSSETDALYRFTSGWPALCTLIAEYLKRHPETKVETIIAHPFRMIPSLSDYLNEEIFRKESERLQVFLLKTSLIVELDPNILSNYLEINDTREIVSYLQHNRFYTFTNAQGHCQCWNVFRAFLYHKYLEENAELISDQHSMLAELYRQRRFYIEAFCHAVAGNDYMLASSIVQQISNRYNAVQFINLIDGHLEQISPELHFSNTSLFLTRCIPDEILSEFIPLLKELIALEEREENYKKLADLQNRLGAIYYHLGYVELAASLLTASSELAADFGDNCLLACDLQLLADCHLICGDMSYSLKCAKKALFISEENNLLTMQVHTLEVLSRISLEQNDLNRSRQYLREALHLSEDEPFLSLWLYVDQSILKLNEGDTECAIHLAKQACSCIVPENTGYDTSFANLALGRAYMRNGNYRAAAECLDIAIENAQHCGFLLYESLVCRRELSQLQDAPTETKELELKLSRLCKDYNYTWSPWYKIQITKSRNSDQESLLTIRTMGAFEVFIDHQPVKIKRSSSISLLQFLIINCGNDVNKEVIIDHIFPYETSGCDNHFNVALSVLRKSLQPNLKSGKDSKYILRNKQAYQLNENTVYIDAKELLYICSKITEKSGYIDTRLTARFNELYRGEFMADYPYEDFLEPTRQRINWTCLETMRFIANHYKESQTPARSIEYYERILAADPYYESVALDYIDLLLSLRASHKARDVADQLIRSVENELGSPVTDQIKEVFRRYGIKYK